MKRETDFHVQNLHRKCPEASSMTFGPSASVREYKLVKRGRTCECITLAIAVAVSSLHSLKLPGRTIPWVP